MQLVCKLQNEFMSIRLIPRAEPLHSMKVWAPVIALALTLLAGFFIFLILEKNPWKAYQAFFIDPISDVNGISELILKASPLCLIALGLAVCYRANIWNIGAEGQMYVGGIFASGVAIYFYESTAWQVLPLMVLAGAAGGALWSCLATNGFHL